jgi:hypothetical protein
MFPPQVVVTATALDPVTTLFDSRWKLTDAGLAATVRELTAVSGVTFCLPTRTACAAAKLGMKPTNQQKSIPYPIDLRIQINL